MTNFVAWIPPAGEVVEAPVHPETEVLCMWSDGSIDDNPCRAGDLNWSAEGDGPRVVAYAVVEEYTPAPKVAREWWIVDGCEAWDSLKMAQNSLRQLRFRGDEPIIHVREVLEGREVVAWAVVDDNVITPGNVLTLCRAESTAESVAVNHGGTVVRLSGVMPNE